MTMPSDTDPANFHMTPHLRPPVLFFWPGELPFDALVAECALRKRSTDSVVRSVLDAVLPPSRTTAWISNPPGRFIPGSRPHGFPLTEALYERLCTRAANDGTANIRETFFTVIREFLADPVAVLGAYP